MLGRIRCCSWSAQVAGVASPGHRQPVQADGEDQEQEDRHHQRRRGDEGDRQQRQDAVKPRARPQRRDDTKRNAHQQRQRQGAEGQRQRVGNDLEDDVEDRPVRDDILAEIAGRRAC